MKTGVCIDKLFNKIVPIENLANYKNLIIYSLRPLINTLLE